MTRLERELSHRGFCADDLERDPLFLAYIRHPVAVGGTVTIFLQYHKETGFCAVAHQHMARNIFLLL